MRIIPLTYYRLWMDTYDEILIVGCGKEQSHILFHYGLRSLLYIGFL